MLRLLHFVVRAVLFFFVLALIVAIGRPETATAEDVVLAILVVGLLAVAIVTNYRFGARSLQRG